MLKVSVFLVNGGKSDWTVPDSFYRKLLSLRRSGLEGKPLVHELISDDLRPPPTFVTLTGQLEDGTKVKEEIA